MLVFKAVWQTGAHPLQIKVAEVGYKRPTLYERYAPGQLRNIVDVVEAVTKHSQALPAPLAAQQ